MHGDIPADLVLLDNLFVEYRRSTLGVAIALELGALLVGGDVVPLQRRLLLGDDGYVDVGTRAEIVPDTGQNGVAGQLDGLLLIEVGLPLGLEDAHGSEGAGAHGDVGQLVGAAVGVDGEEVGAGGVAAGDDEVGTDVALVAEEVLLEHGHAGDDAGLAARREGV